MAAPPPVSKRLNDLSEMDKGWTRLTRAAPADHGKAAPMIIGDTARAAEVLNPLFVQPGETVAVIHLGPEQRLIAVTLEATGGDEDVALPIGAILKKALRLGAEALVVAHNHPSGDPSPSEADHQATRALAAAADKVGIRLHDHIIFGGGESRSFRALGFL